jgi:hypothetical protein
MSPGTVFENIKTQKHTFPAKKVLNPIHRNKRQKHSFGDTFHTKIKGGQKYIYSYGNNCPKRTPSW